ncbi:MAG TPA: 50S ribosomal protein L9 [Acidimicrobiales bacterium]|nr:50S ribosomal protein L9 [Acidimicrobiales bacterium]
MRIVLRTDVEGIGKRGDLVEVSDGHARNFLLPSGQAIAATRNISTQATAMRRARDVADQHAREAAESIAQQLVPVVITVHAHAGKAGRLFGSVTPAEIVAAVEAQTSVVLDRHKLIIHEPIKSVGTHEVGVHLHPEVEFVLTVEVVG